MSYDQILQSSLNPWYLINQEKFHFILQDSHIIRLIEDIVLYNTGSTVRIHTNSYGNIYFNFCLTPGCENNINEQFTLSLHSLNLDLNQGINAMYTGVNKQFHIHHHWGSNSPESIGTILQYTYPPPPGEFNISLLNTKFNTLDSDKQLQYVHIIRAANIIINNLNNISFIHTGGNNSLSNNQTENKFNLDTKMTVGNLFKTYIYLASTVIIPLFVEHKLDKLKNGNNKPQSFDINIFNKKSQEILSAIDEYINKNIDNRIISTNAIEYITSSEKISTCNTNSESDFKKKYLKYKSKYLNLRKKYSI